MNLQGKVMDRQHYKIYCAGPLFNPKEREEMSTIASVLTRSGYSIFLPQENGLKFAELLPALIEKKIETENATKMLNMAIFSLDVFEVMNADGLILNMNGRVPDEGAMVEAGIAWSHNKTIVIFKNDDRSLIQGNCNPLVMGLSDFEFVDKYEEIPTAFDRNWAEPSKSSSPSLSSNFETVSKNGQKISNYLSRGRTSDEVVELLIKLFTEVSCLISKDPKTNSFQASTQP